MKKNLIAAVLVFGFASSAMATDGDVKILAKVSESVSMSFDSGDVEAGGALADGVLDHTIDFDDVAATATATTLVEKTVSMRLRSNVGYVLKANASVTTGSTTDLDALGLGDIGFAVTDIQPATTGSGSLVTGTHTGDAVDTYAYDLSAVDVSTGEVTFPASLEAFDGTATDVVAGGRISKGGNVKSQNNYIKVDTKYAILPQFFTPTTSFVAVVNYTLSAVP